MYSIARNRAAVAGSREEQAGVYDCDYDAAVAYLGLSYEFLLISWASSNMRIFYGLGTIAFIGSDE